MHKNTPNTIDDFWELVDKTSDCWLWKGSIGIEGYGQFMYQGKRWRAHRFSYNLIHPFIKGLVLDHLCEVRNCVNPDHLRQVTNRENVLRGNAPTAINARKEYCKNDHKFTDDTTYRYKDGRRDCRICMYSRMKKYYNDNKDSILERTKNWYQSRKVMA